MSQSGVKTLFLAFLYISAIPHSLLKYIDQLLRADEVFLC
jgi:hypothetical protein